MDEDAVHDLLAGSTCHVGERAPGADPTSSPVSLNARQARYLRRIAAGEIGEKEPGERVRAVRMLERLADDPAESRTLLATVIEADAPPEVRIQAIRTLTRMGASGAAQVLRQVLAREEEHPAVAMAAARDVARLGLREAAADLDRLAERLEGRDGDALRASITDLKRLRVGLD